jgi:putative phosphoribosyl transferase
MHMIFRDRIDAAEKLAEKLEWLKKEEGRGEKKSSIIVLAIPRGGVVIGDIISRVLNAKLDVVVSRKIGAPYNPELAIGAVMPDGSFFPNENIIRMLKISEGYINAEIDAQMKEIERRLIYYRGGSKDYGNELQNKRVILVDDGIATGATILAAAQWIKKKQNCKELVIAVPVAPRQTMDDLNKIADKVVVLHAPSSFEAVGQFYQDFSQVSDNEVKEIMSRREYKI